MYPQAHLTGAPLRCTLQVHLSGVPQECLSCTFITRASQRCTHRCTSGTHHGHTSQVHLTGVPQKCISEVYLTGVTLTASRIHPLRAAQGPQAASVGVSGNEMGGQGPIQPKCGSSVILGPHRRGDWAIYTRPHESQVKDSSRDINS